jgi:simple sugar transport system permease protein
VPTVSIPLLDRLPVLGSTLFSQPLIVYIGFALVVFTAWAFRSTNAGLNLNAAGQKPEALDAAGVSVIATRSWAALATGALAGVGGAYLSIVGAGIFTPFITQGQGFIAIVICMLARGRPLWVIMGSFLFGVSLSVSDALQIAGFTISTDVINMLPFVAIIVALILFARRSYLPPALALPYVRGAR